MLFIRGAGGIGSDQRAKRGTELLYIEAESVKETIVGNHDLQILEPSCWVHEGDTLSYLR